MGLGPPGAVSKLTGSRLESERYAGNWKQRRQSSQAAEVASLIPVSKLDGSPRMDTGPGLLL